MYRVQKTKVKKQNLTEQKCLTFITQHSFPPLIALAFERSSTNSMNTPRQLNTLFAKLAGPERYWLM